MKVNGLHGMKIIDPSEIEADVSIVLDGPGQAALQTFFQSGGVYTGVHSASACLFNDTNYLQAVGG